MDSSLAASSNAGHKSSSSSFLQLPLEVSDMIQRRLFDDIDSNWANLLRVNKLIHHEARSIMRKRHAFIVVVVDHPDSDASRDFLDHLLRAEGCWAITSRKKEARRIFSLCDEPGAWENSQYYDMQWTIKFPLMIRRAYPARRRLLVVGQESLATFADRLVRWRGKGCYAPKIENFPMELNLTIAKAHKQSLLQTVTTRLWSFSQTKLHHGCQIDISTIETQKSTTRPRWGSFQELQEEIDRLCDSGRQSWTMSVKYEQAYEETMKHLTLLWDHTSLAWLQHDYHMMKGVVTKVDGDWSATDILRTTIPATRLAMANIEANRAFLRRGTESDTAMLRGYHHAVMALRELAEMERVRAEPLAIVTLLRREANMLVYVICQELNRPEECQTAADAVKEEYYRRKFVFDLNFEIDYMRMCIQGGVVTDPRIVV